MKDESRRCFTLELDAWPSRNGVAEAEGFEPPVAFTTAVFKTAAFDRSATLPPGQIAEFRRFVKRCALERCCWGMSLSTRTHRAPTGGRVAPSWPPFSASSFRNLLAPVLRALKANWAPALLLQAFALVIAVGYALHPRLHELMVGVGQLKDRAGLLYSVPSTFVFGGLIPYLVLLGSGRIPPKRRFQDFVFYAVFWAYKGVEIEGLYGAQTAVFGESSAPSTIVLKTLVDQFVYNPLWAAPMQTFVFLWRDVDYSWQGLRGKLEETSFRQRVMVVLISTWIVWLPAVAIIYSLPGPLQLPLANLVLCFWCLLLSVLSADSGGPPIRSTEPPIDERIET